MYGTIWFHFSYIEWRSHEPYSGLYNFAGDLDVVQYIKLAQQHQLFVILRIGPFIAAERDMVNTCVNI